MFSPMEFTLLLKTKYTIYPAVKKKIKITFTLMALAPNGVAD
jgi:hypothetical protein